VVREPSSNRSKQLFTTVGTFGSELIFANGNGASIGAPRLVRQKIEMRSTGQARGVETTPTDVFDSAALFRIYIT
jgi:hypothetical protein